MGHRLLGIVKIKDGIYIGDENSAKVLINEERTKIS